MSPIAPMTVDEMDVVIDALELLAVDYVRLLKLAQKGTVREQVEYKLSVARSLLTFFLETRENLARWYKDAPVRTRCDEAWEFLV